MIAGLYHDITTPPFSHATEQILRRYFGFDHEKHLRDLMLGESKDLGMYYFQIYQGKEFKLRSICQEVEARRRGIDLFQILALLSGEGLLSTVINGEIDIDNIDNVIRAASAMGVTSAKGRLAESLASSFIFQKDQELAFSAEAEDHIESWRKFRETLYDMILCSTEDFAFQTMLKHALLILAKTSDESLGLREDDWKLTEQQMLYERILRNPQTEKIAKRMYLKDLYTCIGTVWARGSGVQEYFEKNDLSLGKLAEDFFKVPAIMDYYEDKRYRIIKRPLALFSDRKMPSVTEAMEPALLVGFFTPSKTAFDKDSRKNLINAKRKEDFICKLRDILPESLSLRRVAIVDGKYPHLDLREEIV
jgi:HD superfamily phosphohydrolase